jgi:PAS domain S-box-containing protein
MANAQVLVVEDEAIVAKNIKAELNSMGYEVPAIAASGEEALQKAAQVQPDLVLMDIVLKGDMDGVETTARLHERFDVPVVYLTAYCDDQTLERAKWTEPFGYLLKPYEERELRTTIELALYKHRMERKLKETQEWLAAILRCMGEAIIVIDSKSCIRMMNDAAEALIGRSQEDAKGRDLLEVFHLVDAETRLPIWNPAGKAFHHHAVVDLDERALLLATDGSERPVQGSVAPVYDPQGCLTGFVLAFRDPTARRPPARTLNGSQDRSGPGREADSLDKVAHDFNQLLTVILGNVSLVLQGLPETDPHHRFLAATKDAASRAAELVKNLLMAPQGTTPQPEHWSLNAIVQEMVSFLRDIADPAIHMDLQLAPNLWTVQADAVQISGILLHLCLNARDAMPKGGQLLLETRNVVFGEDPSRWPLPARSGEFVCLSIRDAGQPIAPGNRPLLCEPFFPTEEPENGTGLGFASVCRIVEQHGGWVEYSSRIDQGTRFVIYLPRYSAENRVRNESVVTVPT